MLVIYILLQVSNDIITKSRVSKIGNILCCVKEMAVVGSLSFKEVLNIAVGAYMLYSILVKLYPGRESSRY